VYANLERLDSICKGSPALLVEIAYMKQAVLRITFQKTEWEQLFSASYSVVKGALRVSCAIIDRKPMDLIEAIIDTHKDGKNLVSLVKSNRKEEWFSHIRVLKVLCCEDFSKFLEYFRALSHHISSHRKGPIRKEVLLMVISLLGSVVCDRGVSEELEYRDDCDGSTGLMSTPEIAVRSLYSITQTKWLMAAK
jgi:hypothetical protein